MKTKKENVIVSYANFQIAEVIFRIEGTEPLIVNKFSDKGIKEIEDKHTQKAKGGKKARNPKDEYLAARHLFADNKRHGFPAGGFKKSMVRAGKQLGYSMTDLRAWFFVEPEEKESNLLEIIGEPEMRCDMVRIPSGATPRYRPGYNEWTVSVRIRYNSSCISVEQLAELLALAGFSVGVGEWRPEKSGNYGKWRII